MSTLPNVLNTKKLFGDKDIKEIQSKGDKDESGPNKSRINIHKQRDTLSERQK